MDGLERGLERDLERGPEPGVERSQPLFDLLAGMLNQQGQDTSCLAFCFSLLLSVVASLVVFIFNGIRYKHHFLFFIISISR